MTAECVVRRKTGETREGITITPIYDVVYRGICKPQTFRPQEYLAGHVSGPIRTIVRSEVHFPIGTPMLDTGDVITITKSLNPALVGLHYRVAADDLSAEHQTAYHVPVTRDPEAKMPPLPAEEG